MAAFITPAVMFRGCKPRRTCLDPAEDAAAGAKWADWVGEKHKLLAYRIHRRLGVDSGAAVYMQRIDEMKMRRGSATP